MKKRLAQIAAVAMCVAMVGSLAACGSTGGNGDGSAAPEKGPSKASGDTIKVGVVVPMTGALAAFGDGAEEMYQYAVDQINEAGGIEVDGTAKQIELVFADSESNPQKASEAANKLISSDKIDIMLTAKTADTTVPVAGACERAKVLCLSVDTPDEAWCPPDGSTTYNVSYHAGFNTENELNCFKDAWDLAGVTKVAVMHATDTEGQTMINAISGFCDAAGVDWCDPGAYNSGDTDYTSIINKMKSENADAVVGVMLTSDFGTFFSQLKSSGLPVKAVTVAKATLFTADVESADANLLCSEVWWTPDFPYTSSITGQSCAEIADAWQELVPGYDWAPATAGYNYANVEILYNVVKNAGSLDLDKLTAAADALDVETVIGPVKYNEQHYSVQNLVTGQWVKDGDSWTQQIISTTQVPGLETTADIQLLN